MRWLVAILGWRHRETDIPDFVRRTDASTVAAVQRLLMEPATDWDEAEAQTFALAAEAGDAEWDANPSKWQCN